VASAPNAQHHSGLWRHRKRDGSNAQNLDIPGTGLGLAIVPEIVTQHEGNIDVQSELGAGTTFRICFPTL
jgi:signal transduction histidine kinase